jgi:hypothetical protein
MLPSTRSRKFGKEWHLDASKWGEMICEGKLWFAATMFLQEIPDLKRFCFK